MAGRLYIEPARRERLLQELLEGGDGRGINTTDSVALRSLKRLLPHAAREPLRRLLTLLLAPYGRRRAGRAAERAPVRLNLGSGFTPVAGWTSVDLAGAPVDVPWDLRRGIPFADGTVDAVFSEHLLEHIPIADGAALVRDAVRALRPGGVFRVAVPDAGALLRSYAGTGDETWALSRSTRMQSVMSLFYEHGHRTMYDAELLVGLCELAGLTDVQVSDYRESRLGAAVPDGEHRRHGTLYVEGVKP